MPGRPGLYIMEVMDGFRPRARLLWMLPACLVALSGLWQCAPAGPSSAPALVTRTQMHMGTLVTITGVAPDEAVAQRAVVAGFAEVRRLDALLSTWIPTSELSRVNTAAGQGAVPVSPDTFELVARSLDIAAVTDWGLNIAIGPAVETWSVTERMHVPTADELAALKPIVDLSRIHLDPTARTIRLEQAGMRIDVGGIGKGFAADRAVAVMRAAGASAGVVALSGDIRTFGRLPEGARFRFGIQHPRRPEAVLASLELENEAISTAGDYERYFEREGVRYHHILDPATLQPSRLCQSVTIVATDGITADGLDTGIFVMGPERGMALIEQLPDVEGVIVDRTGRVLISSGLRSRLRMESSP